MNLHVLFVVTLRNAKFLYHLYTDEIILHQWTTFSECFNPLQMTQYTA